MKKIEYVAYAVAIVLSMRKAYIKAFKSRKQMPRIEEFCWYREEDPVLPF